MIEWALSALFIALGLWFLAMPVIVTVAGLVIAWRDRGVPYIREPWRWYR